MPLKEQLRFQAFFQFQDEVTTINNQSWISIHCYVVEHWRQVSILLTLEQLVEGGTTINI
jgi:hypothetical protein